MRRVSHPPRSSGRQDRDIRARIVSWMLVVMVVVGATFAVGTLAFSHPAQAQAAPPTSLPAPPATGSTTGDQSNNGSSKDGSSNNGSGKDASKQQDAPSGGGGAGGGSTQPSPPGVYGTMINPQGKNSPGAQPDSSSKDSGSGDGSGSSDPQTCSTDPNSNYGFELISPTGDGGGTGSGTGGGAGGSNDRSYMICGPSNYYLTYVDFTAWYDVGSKISPGTQLDQGGDHGLDKIASVIFESNAQMIAFTISVLDFGLSFDLVKVLGGPIDQVVGALGNGILVVYIGAAWAVALAMVAWKTFVRERMAEGLGDLLWSAFVGAAALWLIAGHSMAMATYIDDTTNGITDSAFGALTKLQSGSQSEKTLKCKGAESCISANVWKRYVLDPWARIQISESSQKIANDNAEKILKDSDPGKRRDDLQALAKKNEKDVKPTVDFVNSTTHVLLAGSQLFAGFFFMLLILTLVFLLIAEQFILLLGIMTAPVWMLGAVIPATHMARKYLFYLGGAIFQIFGYKLLIGLYLVIIGAVFAAFGGTEAFLINAILSLVAFIKRKRLRGLLAPTALGRQLNARWEAGGMGGASAASGGRSTDAGGYSTAGAGSGAGGGASGSAGGVIMEATEKMASGGYSPEAVRQAGSGVAGAVAVAGGRAASRAPGALREDTDTRLEEAAYLHSLAQKRAKSPESLSSRERSELEEAERLMGDSNDPLARVSGANRSFVRRSRDRIQHRRRREGLSTDQSLAGPRRDGESEREYMARKKEAREQAKRQKEEIKQLAAQGLGFNKGKPSDDDGGGGGDPSLPPLAQQQPLPPPSPEDDPPDNDDNDRRGFPSGKGGARFEGSADGIRDREDPAPEVRSPDCPQADDPTETRGEDHGGRPEHPPGIGTEESRRHLPYLNDLADADPLTHQQARFYQQRGSRGWEALDGMEADAKGYHDSNREWSRIDALLARADARSKSGPEVSSGPNPSSVGEEGAAARDQQANSAGPGHTELDNKGDSKSSRTTGGRNTGGGEDLHPRATEGTSTEKFHRIEPTPDTNAPKSDRNGRPLDEALPTGPGASNKQSEPNTGKRSSEERNPKPNGSSTTPSGSATGVAGQSSSGGGATPDEPPLDGVSSPDRPASWRDGGANPAPDSRPGNGPGPGSGSRPGSGADKDKGGPKDKSAPASGSEKGVRDGVGRADRARRDVQTEAPRGSSQAESSSRGPGRGTGPGSSPGHRETREPGRSGGGARTDRPGPGGAGVSGERSGQASEGPLNKKKVDAFEADKQEERERRRGSRRDLDSGPGRGRGGGGDD